MMSDEDGVDILPKAYYDEIIDDFVKLTNTDIALAMYYLGDCNYDLKVAFEKYELDDHIVMNGFHVPCSQLKSNELEQFSVLSWNLEGLLEKDFTCRTQTVINTINKRKANIVFLQELVKQNELEIRKQLDKDYNIFTADGDYYCGILVKKHPDIRTRKKSLQIRHFDNTRMDRHLVILTVEINDIPVKLITSHLESTKEFSNIRKAQLKEAFDEMKMDTDFSIFAGDLNLRDHEVTAIGGLPIDIVDVWEATGKRYEIRFTWDPQRNFNAAQNCPGAYGARFDRMYCYANSKATSKVIKPKFLGLEGLQKIERGVRYPSDHWALLAFFDVE